MSKPIHPLSYTTQVSSRQVSDFCVAGMPEFDAVSERDTRRWSSASSSIDLHDPPESFESEIYNRSANPSGGFKCGMCERFLSQRSPWGSHRISRSGDMPVTGVLSCHHVFHAECLEQATPKMFKSDPPCPICVKAEEDNLTEQRGFSRLRTGFPRLRPFCEDGPQRTWGCAQVGDCVEGALHAPPRNTMLLLNRNRIKKNLILKGNSSKEFPGKIRKSSSSYSSQHSSGKSVDKEAVASKMTAGPILKS